MGKGLSLKPTTSLHLTTFTPPEQVKQEYKLDTALPYWILKAILVAN